MTADATLRCVIARAACAEWPYRTNRGGGAKPDTIPPSVTGSHGGDGSFRELAAVTQAAGGGAKRCRRCGPARNSKNTTWNHNEEEEAMGGTGY